MLNFWLLKPSYREWTMNSQKTDANFLFSNPQSKVNLPRYRLFQVRGGICSTAFRKMRLNQTLGKLRFSPKLMSWRGFTKSLKLSSKKKTLKIGPKKQTPRSISDHRLPTKSIFRFLAVSFREVLQNFISESTTKAISWQKKHSWFEFYGFRRFYS